MLWLGRYQAHQARARRLGAASRERRARHERFWRRLPQKRAHEATGTWWMGTGCVERLRPRKWVNRLRPHPFGQDVLHPIGHEHDVHLTGGEFDTLSTGDGAQTWTHDAIGTRWTGPGRAEQRHEGHGKAARPAPWPPPGHPSGGECCLLVPAARQRAGRHLVHGDTERASLLDESLEYSSIGQFIYPSTWRQIWERIKRYMATPHPGGMGEGPRDNAACARRHDLSLSLWQLQANELADEQAKKGSALHPSVAQVEQSYSARATCLGWLAKFLGRLHAYMKFRGRRDVAPRVQRQRRMLPGRLGVFQLKPRKKRATFAKFSGTLTLARTGSCWFC